ncbi:GM16459 [Drosophila sechellia]|uniref:GM16459 n=1 Tax=Drosophila sechellia TaxID=7238 RepID=B4IJ47_DROSE|nr:GM16459 [Drosophila sechellia]
MVHSSQVFIVALLALTVVNANPVVQQPASAQFTSAVSRFLRAFRSIMPCGYGDLPVMSPIVSPFYEFEHISEDFSVVGNVTNIRIQGIDGFQVLSASDYGKTGEAAYDVLFPKIQVLGFAEIDGFINIGGFKVPIQQNDVINEALVDLRFVGSYSFDNSLTNSSGLRMVNFRQTIYLAGAEFDNWNTLWNISTNNFWNRLMQSLLPLALEEIQPNITNILYQNFFVPKINDLLANVSMSELVSFLQIQAQLWENANCQAQ